MKKIPPILFNGEEKPIYLDVSLAMELLESYKEVMLCLDRIDMKKEEGIDRQEVVDFFKIYRSFKQMLPKALSNYHAIERLEFLVEESLSDLKEKYGIL